MVVKDEVTTETVTKHRWYCDICGRQMALGCSKHTCEICGCDVCSACSCGVEEYWVYCLNCWTAGKEFRKRFKEEAERHDKMQNDIIQGWKISRGVKI